MSTINVGQAIFASSERGRIQGYQMIGKSSDLDRSCCRELSRWAATRLSGANPGDWSLNFFPVGDDFAAVTRTALGGPEYSRRGGAEVVTTMMVMNHQQFTGFDCDAVAVARTALAMGYLRLPPSHVPASLPPISLPSRPLVNSDCHRESAPDSTIRRIVEALDQTDQLAILGEPDPIELAGKVIRHLPLADRLALSFTTGLEPATSRPFRIHFVSRDQAQARRKLAAHGVTSVFALEPPN